MSTPFVSPAWVEQLPGLARDLRLGDFTGAVDVVVTDAPGKVRFGVEVVNGTMTAAAVGKPKNANVGIEITAKGAAALLAEELDPAVAYMRGDLKVNDDYEVVVYDWRQAYNSDEWAAFVAELRAVTAFDD